MDGHGHMHAHELTSRSMKMDYGQDPYSFVEESTHPPPAKKRGRKKKSEMMDEIGIPKSISDEMDAKGRKRHDRFNGLSEAEVSQRTLPDHLSPNLDIVIVGINPGLFAAFKGHHYAGPGNHFWKCLYMSGLVPEPLTAEDDYNLLHYGIGFTNMVARPTKGSADLTRREIKQGSQILLQKLQKYQPKVAVFNGKLIYEVFSGKKDFPFGRQPELVEGTQTHIWVMPSSSARCAQLPRAADKVPFYSALKKFKDYLNGLISELDDSEITFSESKPKIIISEENSSIDGGNSRRNELLLQDNNDNPPKKKRGRPRKGMEKQSTKDKKLKPDQEQDKNKVVDMYFDGVEVPRKRRGRPKKPKLVTTPPAPLDSSPVTIKTCSSSVSSGYSTGTNGSNEERRRCEEPGSGSGGPSPNIITNSDLSSEISTNINTPPPQTSQQQTTQPPPPPLPPPSQQQQSHHTHNTSIQQSNNNNTGGLFQDINTNESNYSINFYDNPNSNHHHLNNRNNFNNQRGGGGDGGVEVGMEYSSVVNYEPKVVDVASKSLSGLESLVDQIPSISEGDVVGSSAVGGGGVDAIVGGGNNIGGSSLSNYSSSAESGFLPYSQTYTPTNSHYSTPPYYSPHEYSPYVPPPLFSYPTYSTHYSNPHYTHPTPYSQHYSHYSQHYSQSQSTSSPSSVHHHTNPTRFNQRLNIRNDNMDIPHMGYMGHGF